MRMGAISLRDLASIMLLGRALEGLILLIMLINLVSDIGFILKGGGFAGRVSIQDLSLSVGGMVGRVLL